MHPSRKLAFPTVLALLSLVAAQIACNFPQGQAENPKPILPPVEVAASATPFTPGIGFEPAPTLPQEIAAPEPSSGISPEAGGLRLVGYYAGWNMETRGYPVSAVPASRLTHLIYAFAGIHEGKCVYTDPDDDAENITALAQLKQQYPHLKLLLSIGGAWSTGEPSEAEGNAESHQEHPGRAGAAEGFSRAAVEAASRQKLADSCVQLAKSADFDGLDLDWEFPQPEQRRDFTALLADFRASLDAAAVQDGRSYLLTAALGASPYQYQDIDLADIAPLVDWVNLMTYNYHGKWSALTGFNAPLFASSGDLAASQVERQTFNVDAAVQALLSGGVPAEKIMVGVPFYGRRWSGVPAGKDGLYQPFDVNAANPESGASVDYRDIDAQYLAEGSGFTRFWDAEAQVPWLYNPAQQVMLSYDDPQSIALKAEYIRKHGLGGAFVWQLGMDDAQASLLSALDAGLHANP